MYHRGGRAPRRHHSDSPLILPALQPWEPMSALSGAPATARHLRRMHRSRIRSHFLFRLLPLKHFLFCVVLHESWHNSFTKAKLFLVEEVGLMKPSWGPITGWGGTAENRSPKRGLPSTGAVLTALRTNTHNAKALKWPTGSRSPPSKCSSSSALLLLHN